MAIFDNFPYTNIHDLNTDWLVKTVKKVYDKTELVDQAVLEAQTRAENARLSAENAETYLHLLQLNVITPEMYGAVGDGANDDTAALQSCIQDDKIVLLKNIYRISAPLDLTDYKNIMFIGGTITRNANQTFNSIIGSNCDNITFDHVRILGNGNDQNMTYTWEDNVQGCMLIHGHCKNLKITNCVIDGFNYGLYILGPDVEMTAPTYDNMSFNGVVENCVFHNCNSPIDTYGKALRISHNVFYDITGNAVQIEPYENSTVVPNPLNDYRFYGSAFGCDIVDNLFVSVAKICMTVFANNTYAININKNTCIDFDQGVVINSDKYKGTVIDNNFFYYQKTQTLDANTRPWNMKGVISTSGKCWIKNNYIYYAQSAIRLTGYETVDSNIIVSPIAAITVYTSTPLANAPILINNNLVTDHTHDASLWWGMRPIVLGNCKNAMLNNNYVDSDDQPLTTQSGVEANVTNLYSTNAFTGSVTAISGLNKYSN